MGRFQDLTGMKFGMLTVLKRDYEREKKREEEGKRKVTYWLCQCECKDKTIKSVEGYSLKNGNVVSCGCYGREQRLKAITKHGLSPREGNGDNRLKRIYYNMRSRCYNPNTPKFYNYGGRGIKVCNE